MIEKQRGGKKGRGIKEKAETKQKLPRACTKSPIPIYTVAVQDASTTVYDYVVNTVTGQWEPWSARVPQWKPPKGQVSFGSLLVPTADSVRHEALLRAAHSVGRAGLLVGGAGAMCVWGSL